jgi:hypothetical protein
MLGMIVFSVGSYGYTLLSVFLTELCRIQTALIMLLMVILLEQRTDAISKWNFLDVIPKTHVTLYQSLQII